MKYSATVLPLLLLASVVLASNAPPPRIVDLEAPDGVALKATYFAASVPGPGALLLHQINRDRKSWDALAARLAAAGVHTLTLDLRGFGDSGDTRYPALSGKERAHWREQKPGDIDTAWQFLLAQPGVDANVVGIAGAGAEGVDDAVQAARRHPERVKSLVLISGETGLPGMRFLQQPSSPTGLFVVADDDEYPPTQEAMMWAYLSSSNPGSRLARFPGRRPPWVGFEDAKGVPAKGTHGTDMFRTHPELSDLVVDWFATTLIRTPGRAPADALSCAAVLRQIEAGEVAAVTQKLAEARRADPHAQLFPELSAILMGYDRLREGDTKLAVETMRLAVAAYPDSPDAHDSLSDAYLADGQKDLARDEARKALTLLPSDTADSVERRTEIRDSAQAKLQQLTTQP